MGQFSSYYLYQKFERRGSQDWTPCIPNTFSVSGDSQIPMPLSMKNECDSQCGCQESIIERWVNIDPSIDWICDGTSKYYKQQKQISYDYGTTWIPLDTYRQGALIETSSSDCTSPMPTIYRWYASGYTCIGYDKWVQSIRQVSYDNGNTWSNVEPTEYSATTLVEANSEYCGYVPPTPTASTKFIAYYSDSTTYSAACDATSVVTTSDTRAHSTSYTAMTSCAIGNCVTSIDNYAFENCSGLTNVMFEQGSQLSTIGYYAFENCFSLTNIVFPNSLTSINFGAFVVCTGLTSVVIPNSVTTIGDYAFTSCSGLTSVTIPNSVTSIGQDAFDNCSSLTNVTIGSGVTSIGVNAFNYCPSLTSINIPDSVTSIGAGAFQFCGSLTSCAIGSGVTSIGNYAFNFCDSLRSITINATTPPTLGSGVFNYTSNNLVIYVPAESVSAYQSAWSDYASRIQGIP